MTELSFNPDTLEGALQAGTHGMQSEWIQAHLRLPYNHNEGLAQGLLSVNTRAYLGPIKIEFADLQRVCGPEPGMPFPEGADNWSRRIEFLLKKLREGWNPPPFIVAGSSQKPLYLADGNHRLVALQEFGMTEYWAILYFENSNELELFLQTCDTDILKP